MLNILEKKAEVKKKMIKILENLHLPALSIKINQF
jgi:hypothetical protein